MAAHIVEHRRELRAFLRLPERLYARDPAWVAPLRAVVGSRLLAEGFTSDRRRFRLILAHRGDEVVGRAAVFREPAHDAHKDENVAFFGFFEAADEEAGREVLEVAAAQARAWGAERLRGPRGITRIDPRGVLVEGEHLAPFLAGHHPPWYAPFFEAQGFETHHEALAYAIELLDEGGRPAPLPEKLAAKAAAVSIPGLEIGPFRWSRLRRDLDLAHEVMVEAFRDVPDNTPIPRRTFRALATPLLGLTDPEMLQLARVDGRAAGFALCVPELNEALLHARGGLGPRGLWGAWRGRAALHTASFKLLGVLPAYRGTGLHARMIQAACEGVQRAGYTRLEASLIDSRNAPMRRVVEGAGMTVYRRYRVYERSP